MITQVLLIRKKSLWWSGGLHVKKGRVKNRDKTGKMPYFPCFRVVYQIVPRILEYSQSHISD